VNRWVILAFLAIAGVGLIAAPKLIALWPVVAELTRDVGISLLIAAALGTTVDFWFKHKLAKDVFEAAVGYLLPEELREEMRYLYANRLFCDQHFQRATITPLNGDTVLLSVKTERLFVNAVNRDEKVHLSLRIDEWHESRESRLVEYFYRLNDEPEVAVDISTAKREENGLNLEIPGEIVVKKGDRLRLRYTYEEVKRRNDSHLTTFRNPTKNPRVEVDICDGLTYEVGFSNRPEARRDAYPGVATLSGVLLPHQYIELRWWDAAQAARFVAPPAS